MTMIGTVINAPDPQLTGLPVASVRVSGKKGPSKESLQRMFCGEFHLAVATLHNSPDAVMHRVCTIAITLCFLETDDHEEHRGSVQ
jgi:hypothetical protein